MSSMDAATLEFFVRDSMMNGVSDEECAQIVKILEPDREAIEMTMESFDKEEHSWRDYRNGMSDYFEKYKSQIDAVLHRSTPKE